MPHVRLAVRDANETLRPDSGHRVPRPGPDSGKKVPALGPLAGGKIPC
jgi:hypothetical protein